MEVFAESTATATIHCAAEKIDLTEWIFTLRDDEYQSCSKGNIAGGISISKDGKRMSINVEKVADNLLVQHYIEEIGDRNHCRVNSVSDSISSFGTTKLNITWELKVTALSNNSCEFSNHVIVGATEEFLALLKSINSTDLAIVKSQMLENVVLHNEEETALFAINIERKAIAGIWN
jgi:hypothetical protein